MMMRGVMIHDDAVVDAVLDAVDVAAAVVVVEGYEWRFVMFDRFDWIVWTGAWIVRWPMMMRWRLQSAVDVVNEVLLVCKLE